MSHTWGKLLTPIRRWLYPRLDPGLEQVGAYSVVETLRQEYTGTLELNPGEAAYLLAHILGFTPNPIAAQKHLAHQDWATGSWAYRYIEEPGDGPEWLPDWLHPYLPDWMAKMQLHVTLYEAKTAEGLPATDVYAHYEYSWIVHPLKHKYPNQPPDWMPEWLYSGGSWQPESGVERMREMLDEAQMPYLDDPP